MSGVRILNLLDLVLRINELTEFKINFILDTKKEVVKFYTDCELVNFEFHYTSIVASDEYEIFKRDLQMYLSIYKNANKLREKKVTSKCA